MLPLGSRAQNIWAHIVFSSEFLEERCFRRCGIRNTVRAQARKLLWKADRAFVLSRATFSKLPSFNQADLKQGSSSPLNRHRGKRLRAYPRSFQTATMRDKAPRIEVRGKQALFRHDDEEQESAICPLKPAPLPPEVSDCAGVSAVIYSRQPMQPRRALPSRNTNEQTYTCLGNKLPVGGLPFRPGAACSFVFSKIRTVSIPRQSRGL
jgi:hypothetical protein